MEKVKVGVTTEQLKEQLRNQTATDASARVMGYYALEIQHVTPGGFENGEDEVEGKN